MMLVTAVRSLQAHAIALAAFAHRLDLMALHEMLGQQDSTIASISSVLQEA